MRRALAGCLLPLLVASAAHGSPTRHVAPRMTIVGAALGDHAGTSVAVIRGQVLIGAPEAGRGAGAAYLVRGRRGTVRLGKRGSIVLRGAPGDAAGTSLARAGDVNGDGAPDLIIGAPGAAPARRGGGGAAYVVFGVPGRSLDLGSLGSRGFRIDGPMGGAAAGTKVAAAGDLNHDGLDDVIVGVPREVRRGLGSDATGAVYVVYGRKQTTDVDLAALGDGGFAVVPEDAGVTFGGGGLAGNVDLNGDHVPDLAVGTDQDMDEGEGELFTLTDRRGANPVVVHYGPSLMPPALGWSAAGGEGGALNGWSLAGSPDMNRDGFGELLVGAPGVGCSRPCFGLPRKEQNRRTGSGSVYVVFGQFGGSPVNFRTRFPGFRIDGPRRGAGAGFAVAAAGDVNGDRIPDVALGAPGLPPSFGPTPSAVVGTGYVVYGRRRRAIIDLRDLGSRGFVLRGRERGDGTGKAVAGGDLLGSRRPELVVGAPRARGSRGVVYVASAPAR